MLSSQAERDVANLPSVAFLDLTDVPKSTGLVALSAIFCREQRVIGKVNLAHFLSRNGWSVCVNVNVRGNGPARIRRRSNGVELEETGLVGADPALKAPARHARPIV